MNLYCPPAACTSVPELSVRVSSAHESFQACSRGGGAEVGAATTAAAVVDVDAIAGEDGKCDSCRTARARASLSATSSASSRATLRSSSCLSITLRGGSGG